MLKKIFSEKNGRYFLFFTTLTLVFFSHPFLKIPFDIWCHLMLLRGLYDEGKIFLFWPGQHVGILTTWHYVWYVIFKLLHINDTLAWAKIIHVAQTILSLILVFFSSKIFLRLILPKIKDFPLDYLAFLGVVSWFAGSGTYSVNVQQAWLMWYSVGYQITLPLYLFISALTLKIFYGKMSRAKKNYSIVLILIVTFFTVKTHPSETFYFILFVCFVSILNFDITIEIFKKKFLILIPSIIAFTLLIIYGVDIWQKFTRHFKTDSLLKEFIIMDNHINIIEKTKILSSNSELTVISIILGLLIGIKYGILKKGSYVINKKVFFTLLIISVLFFFIPVTPYIRALFGMIMQASRTWRIVLACPFFIFYPIFCYLFCQKILKKDDGRFTFITGAAGLLILIVLSRFLMWNTLYLNTKSLVNSVFFKEKITMQYTDATVKRLEGLLESAKAQCRSGKCMYYMRGDMAYIARAVLGEYVYQRRWRQPNFHHQVGGFQVIPIQLPDNMPKDEKIFKSFDLNEILPLLKPVYHFRRKNDGSPLYTIRETEKNNLLHNDLIWKYEGIAYYAYPGQKRGTRPVHRFWTSYQSHFYTISKKKILNDHPDWKYAGISWYVYKTQQPDTVPVYFFWNDNSRSYFYTASETEKNDMTSDGSNWKYQGIAWYTLTKGDK
ncbi:MAG: hypothetical protein ACL93V_15910 [Candidatus Electrothrix sp. YB6]